MLGQHTQDSELLSVWPESGILGRLTIQHVIAVKNYAKATCAYKIILQAM